MTSEVKICNRALIKLGDENIISSLTEDGREAETCNQVYAESRDIVLAMHPWNFAIGRSVLSEDTTAPSFEYDNQFLLPSDCLRALEIYNSSADWKIEGDRLLTDEATVNLIYIKKVTDSAQFSPLFVESLATYIASEVAVTITGSKEERERLKKEFKEILREAKRRDGQEGTPNNIRADAYTRGIKTTNTFWNNG